MIQKVLFSKKETESIKNLAETYNKAEVYSNGEIKVKESVRNSYKYPFNDNSVFKNIIVPKLADLGIVDIGYESMLLKYTKGHYFIRHQDRLSTSGNRKKTLVIQLSSADDYDGGELKVLDETASKELGNVILFDAADFHEVKKIKSGTRYCFLAFLEQSDLVVKKNIL